MRLSRRSVASILVPGLLALASAACSAEAGPGDTQAAPAAEARLDVADAQPSPVAVAATDQQAAAVAERQAPTEVVEVAVAAGSLPGLFDRTLTDVVSGESFKLSDSLGRVQVVETMAVWCSLCNRQQKEMVKALEEIGDDVVFISVDVDPNENAGLLARYVESNGFEWPFTAPGAGFARELSLLTSRIVLDPTATPVVIVDREGGLHTLAGRIKSAATLVAEIAKYRG